MIKIDTDFNFNILLKLFFSLSKKIIFFSPILANNNLPLKIYCEKIVIIFHSSFFLFSPSFFILHTRHFFIFFSSFFLLHTRTLTLFFFIPLSSFFFKAIPSNSRTFRALLLRFIFFFLSPFSLSTSSVGSWQNQ